MNDSGYLGKRSRETTAFLKPILGKDLKTAYVATWWSDYSPKAEAWEHTHDYAKRLAKQLGEPSKNKNPSYCHHFPLILEFNDGRFVLFTENGIRIIAAEEMELR